MFRFFFVIVLGLILSRHSHAAVFSDSINPGSVKVPDGYKIEVFAKHLSVPTTAIFDGADLLVAESGHKNTAKPRVLRIKPNGQVIVEAEKGLIGPVTGLLMVDGRLFISHKTKVSVLQPDKSLKDIVTDLPSDGDHQNNNLVLGKDGKMYMGQGTRTNSGVVGEDSYIFGWLPEKPQIHEVPCKDITLNGQNFETDDPLKDGTQKVKTGAYKPFGTPSQDGEVIKGSPKCGGSIVRFNPDGSNFEVVSWGLRNPFGLEVDKEGQVWATFHGADVRGSRSIYNDKDYLVKVEEGAWFGWPEYFDGQPVTESRFKDPTKDQPEFLWKDHPTLTQPFLTFDSHAATNGITFSPGKDFGFEGDAFIAEYGTFAPLTTGVNISPVGFQVTRVNMTTKESESFVSNKIPGPAYITRQGGMNRPSDVVFGPDNSLYIVDWGAATFTKKGLELVPQTGIIWRVYSDNQKSLRPQGPIDVPGTPLPKDQRKPEAANVPQLYIANTSLLLAITLGLLIIGALILSAVLSRRNTTISRKKRK